MKPRCVESILIVIPLVSNLSWNPAAISAPISYVPRDGECVFPRASWALLYFQKCDALLFLVGRAL